MTEVPDYAKARLATDDQPNRVWEMQWTGDKYGFVDPASGDTMALEKREVEARIVEGMIELL